MNRAFIPGGFGFRRPFRPFPHPFFPRRFLFPFFFFSPFFFPFFREEDGGDRNDNDMYFAHHQTQPGDTLDKVAHMYNIPCPILEEANPHIGHPGEIQPGSTVHIPRISHMYCHKTYMEKEEAANLYPSQNMPYPGVPYK
ncbi:LysM peptidoglycan-binding domain-containing protein [Paenibacillus harenae]|uniref:LysM peptidoglycan-binding domain-containing protein n=1 Tax=Paenibacillus harenae TaxID=306543 RepID=UPI0004160B4D|nr:LysM peptidoglycan-binding domain-containing protein [Paenibacillus harenae]